MSAQRQIVFIWRPTPAECDIRSEERVHSGQIPKYPNPRNRWLRYYYRYCYRSLPFFVQWGRYYRWQLFPEHFSIFLVALCTKIKMQLKDKVSFICLKAGTTLWSSSDVSVQKESITRVAQLRLPLYYRQRLHSVLSTHVLLIFKSISFAISICSYRAIYFHLFFILSITIIKKQRKFFLKKQFLSVFFSLSLQSQLIFMPTFFCSTLLDFFF